MYSYFQIQRTHPSHVLANEVFFSYTPIQNPGYSIENRDIQ